MNNPLALIFVIHVSVPSLVSREITKEEKLVCVHKEVFSMENNTHKVALMAQHFLHDFQCPIFKLSVCTHVAYHFAYSCFSHLSYVFSVVIVQN